MTARSPVPDHRRTPAHAARLAFGLALALLGFAILAPLVAPYAPDAIDLAGRRAAPSRAHWFGTDELGRDVLTRVLHGARVSLAIGLLSGALATAFGSLVGAVAGYWRRWADALLMRATDAMLSIPRLPLLMVAAVIIRPSVPVMVALVAAVGWMETARVVRAEVLSLSTRGFVDAARASGTRGAGILGRHIMPNVAPTVAVAATLAVGRAILLESTLSFFGVGVQPPAASWGNMLYQAQTTMASEPWLALFPGLMILVTVITVNALGERLAGAR
jgi:peptide/nickel transport system permease protein